MTGRGDERQRERENMEKEKRGERGAARGQRGRIIRPQNPEAFNIIRYRVSSIGCRGRRERKRDPLEGEREAGRENRREEEEDEVALVEEVEETDGAQEWRDTEDWARATRFGWCERDDRPKRDENRACKPEERKRTIARWSGRVRSREP